MPKGSESYEKLAEEELVRRLRLGDTEGFSEIFNRYEDRVYTICLRMTGNTADAQDMAQSAFVQMVEKIGSIKDPARFKSWFDRLTVNVVLGHLRAGKRQVLLDEEGWEDVLQDEISRPASGAVPDSLDVERALEKLPEGARIVFLLFLVHGYTHEEIAQQLGCSVGTSKTQLFRARKRLVELLT